VQKFTFPGGLTPLHLAASMYNNKHLVDALTSDLQMLGCNLGIYPWIQVDTALFYSITLSIFWIMLLTQSKSAMQWIKTQGMCPDQRLMMSISSFQFQILIPLFMPCTNLETESMMNILLSSLELLQVY
jgi:hypothetical protein